MHRTQTGTAGRGAAPAATKVTGMPPESTGRAARAHARRPRATALACLAAGIAAAASLSACSKFDAALGQQWATVSFKDNTPEATVLKVRAACSHIPNVHAEALPPQANQETMQYAVTYQTNDASDANLAQLEECLQRYPSVAGVDFEDSGDDGG
jgi:hypothetical protein